MDLSMFSIICLQLNSFHIAHWEEQRHKSKFEGFQERQF